MLQPDPAHPIGQREEEVVLVEGLAPEGRQGFLDQGAVGGDLIGLGVQLLGLVGDDVERDVLPQVPLAEMGAGEDRRIDQRFIVGLGPGHAVAVRAGSRAAPVERAGVRPARREGDGGLHPDLADVMAGRIEAGRLPLQVQHLARHHDPPFGGLERRGVDEPGGDGARSGGQVDVEGADLDRIALPRERLAVGLKGEVGHFGKRPARPVVAGTPHRIEQRQPLGPGDHGDRLGHPERAALGVRRVDVQFHHARIGLVGRIGHARGDRRRDRGGARGLLGGGHAPRADGEQGGGGRQDHPHGLVMPGRRRGCNCG